jgi:hypothetical protein
MATVNSILSPHELTASGSYTASATYVVLGNAGWTVPRGQTTDALFVAHVGANYARTLNVDSALSTTLQDVEVGGTASALALATTKVQVGSADTDLVGFFGATPVVCQQVGTVPDTANDVTLVSIVQALINLGLVKISA